MEGAELRGFSLTLHILFCSFKTSSGERLILNAPQTSQGEADVVLERAVLCSYEPFSRVAASLAGLGCRVQQGHVSPLSCVTAVLLESAARGVLLTLCSSTSHLKAGQIKWH